MTIIIAILLFGVIIFIHELGHFSFAKLSGVTVHEFSIGMGPKIFSKTKNGTSYSLRAFPIGGFVSMEGEDEESNDPNSFGKKTLLQRLSVIFAGPIFNIILAVVIMIPVFMILGIPTNDPIIGEVNKDMPAYTSGLESGDKIIKIDKIKVNNWEEIVEMVRSSEGHKLEITVERNNKIQNFEVTPIDNQGVYQIGMTQHRVRSLSKSITSSVAVTYDLSKQMLIFVKQLFTGTVPGGVGNSVAGPVGVIGMVSDAAKSGLANLLYYASIISLNLGIVNLVPFPALDGWRILMLIVEGVRGGKKFDANKEGMVNLIGLAVLMVFMIFITYKDILRLFTN
ncbi:MAG: RIP metalloprotease RseP [Clostridioides sp.]|nr:RIP metalloprotease RseP [Clostridioides sp.]